jgi:hypothetical protein
METKEIAMSKRTTILGTACVLGMALAAGSAAAAPLTGWDATVNTSFSANDTNNSGGPTWKGWLLGGSVAGPINGLSGFNIQLDGNYTHNWATHASFEQWNLGGSPFWAGMDNRFGVNVNYDTVTHTGTLTNYGVFGEQYFGNVTGMVKGGFLTTSGSQIGGHGNYAGGALSYYFIPDLAITGSVDWADVVTGRANQFLNRGDVNITAWGIGAEWLFTEDYNVSIYGGYTYDQVHDFGFKDHANVWHVGFRWYTGSGSLVDHHRNGTLNPWLPGVLINGANF